MTDYGTAYAGAVAAELRAERGRTQITVASIVTATGLSKSAVINYLNGKRDIPIPALMDICRALGVDARAIFDRAFDAVKQS